MLEAFIEKKFNATSLKKIQLANSVIREYSRQGYVLTLRQLYYQLVARGYIENTERSYKNTGSLVNDARLAGMIDWSAIEDRTRSLAGYSSWITPGGTIKSAAYRYAMPMWSAQPNYVEVWVEKEALANVVQRACAPRRIPYFSCRGYVSQSEMYAAGKRLAKQCLFGKKIHIIHLGDHDPSGIDMSRDIEERLGLFMGDYGERIRFKRIALNMKQVAQYNPPPNPAKITDSRYLDYEEKFGRQSWELDALEPSVLEGLISAATEPLVDKKMWKTDAAEEEANRAMLHKAADQWEDVEQFLGGLNA